MSGGTYQFQETSQQPGHGSLGHQLRFRTWSMSCELPDVQWLSAKTEARAGATQEEDGEAVGASSGGGMSTVGRRRIILAQDGRVPGASRIPGFLNGGQEGSTPSTLKNQKTQETNTRRTAARSSGSAAVWQAPLSHGAATVRLANSLVLEAGRVRSKPLLPQWTSARRNCLQFPDFHRLLPFFQTFLGDFTPDRLDSRGLQTPWEQKNRVLLEEHYISNVLIPLEVE